MRFYLIDSPKATTTYTFTSPAAGQFRLYRSGCYVATFATFDELIGAIR